MIRAKHALIAVDVQNDFCPGGALAVNEGDAIIPNLNRLIRAFDSSDLPMFFTRDWHPANHCSFKEYGGPWPKHCVRGTRGAEFHPKLEVPKSAAIISKAMQADKEVYSGFQGTELSSRLKRIGVTDVFVGGLATDYCVKNTALDALGNGFTVHVLKDCIKGVNVKKNDSTEAIKEMQARGAELTTSESIIKMLKARRSLSQVSSFRSCEARTHDFESNSSNKKLRICIGFDLLRTTLILKETLSTAYF